MTGLYYWLWTFQYYVKMPWFLTSACVALALTVVDPLACLIGGGVILALLGVNIFLLPHSAINTDEISQYRDSCSGCFAVGRDVELQTWLIIISTGYFMIWMGLAVVHRLLLDWKATLEPSERANGASSAVSHWVFWAVESFIVQNTPRYSILRYTIAITLCIAGFGFQFGVTKLPIHVIRNIPGNSVFVRPLDISTRLDFGAPESNSEIHMEQSGGLCDLWLSDTPGGEDNMAFMHQTPFGDESTGHEGLPTGYGAIHQRPDYFLSPPGTIIMTSTSTVCVPFKFQYGTVSTRQTVMVASMAVDAGNFSMMRDAQGRNRIESRGTTLTDATTSQLVIDYRVESPGKLQVQWARHGEWLTNESADLSEPVIQRVAYNMQYAVAEVTRYIEGRREIGHPSEKSPWKCYHQYTRMPDDWHSAHQLLVKIRSRDSNLITAAEPDASHSLTRTPIISYMSQSNRSILDSISLLVRATMMGWNPSGEHIRRLEEGELPFGDETDTMTEQDNHISIRYPYFEGEIWASGCKKSAAAAHFIIGILALLVVGIQILSAKLPNRAE